MVARQYNEIKKRVEAACLRVGRRPEEVTLIAVSKTKPVEMLREAYEAGARDFGENKVQEILTKEPELPEDIRWHMIGHLQTNKVRQVVGKVDLIQSVGSLHLLEAVNKEAARQNLRQDILLEVNIGEEAAKTGFAASEILPLIDKIDSFSNICVRGLMAIPPISENPGDNSKFFLKMREIYVDIRAKKKDNVQVDCLSMGMSGDYLDAIRCGSTMVRIGTAIFGERHY